MIHTRSGGAKAEARERMAMKWTRERDQNPNSLAREEPGTREENGATPKEDALGQDLNVVKLMTAGSAGEIKKREGKIVARDGHSEVR